MRASVYVFTAAAALLLGSCSGVSDRFSILEANLLSGRGEYRKAVSLYSRAAADPSCEAYASFGLGSVYLALGELEPALKQFRRAAERAAAADPGGELEFRARYDAGIALYRSGDFDGAADAFRRALRIDGARLEAKRNLELCLKAMHRRRAPGASTSQLGVKKQQSDEPKKLFDYIREKESDRWRSREWQADSPDTPDY